MSGVPGRVWVAAAAMAFGLLVLAPMLAPVACAGGNEVYFVAGLGCGGASLALPFLWARPASLAGRLLAALGGGALVGLGWGLGLALSDFRVLCRLF